MLNERIKVLVVDDTALYRKIIKDVLSEIPNIEVVGSAPNGKIALSKIEVFRPDIITLDLEMPEMDGLDTLRQIKLQQKNVAAIMISAHTTKGAKTTLQALELGAFDFITKPDGSNFVDNLKSLKEQFIPKIEAYLSKKNIRKALHPKPQPVLPAKQTAAPVRSKPTVNQSNHIVNKGLIQKPKIVAIGISTGGPKALAEVIPQLPETLPVPVVIVQHMPPVFTKALAESLNKKSVLNIVEAGDGEILKPGTVYIAPGGKQMKISSGSIPEKYFINITDDPPENHCKPSVDYLFRSVAELFPGKALGVIMTGMGRDGTKGLIKMKQVGAKVLSQNEETCVVYGMPMEAVKAGVVDDVVPLFNMAKHIVKVVNGMY